MPHACGSAGSMPGYGSQHHAVRVFSDPSMTTLSGPNVTRPDSSTRAPLRQPSAIACSSRSGQTATSTRSAVTPPAVRADHSATLSAFSNSRMPTTPRAAAASAASRNAPIGSDAASSNACRTSRNFSSRSRPVSSRAISRREPAALFSQPQCRSPLTSTTGTSGMAASIAASEAGSDHSPSRKP